MSTAKKLRELIANGCVAMPGVFNASMGRLVEHVGFEAVYISGAGLCNATAGVPDIGLLTMTEVAQLAGYVARAVKIPCIVDADTGFGGAENAARTIEEFERAGLAGCHIEDQEFPKRCGHLAGKSLIETEEMNEKIAAAAGAKRDPNFLLIARTDARAVESFDKAVERARSYVAAGADAIFPEALQDEQEFRDFAKAVDAPLLANMTEFGKSELFTVQQLADVGMNIVIWPVSLLRLAMGSAMRGLDELEASGSLTAKLGDMQHRAELYELVDYEAYNHFDTSIFNFTVGDTPVVE